MRITITRTNNGFVVKSPEGLVVFEDSLDDENSALIHALQEVASLCEDSSRHSKSRVHVLSLPGDKYEGELTKKQKESLEWLTSLNQK